MATSIHIDFPHERKEEKGRQPLQFASFKNSKYGLRSSNSVVQFLSKNTKKAYQFRGDNQSKWLNCTYSKLLTETKPMNKRQISCTKFNAKNQLLNMSVNEQLELSKQQKELESIYLSDNRPHILASTSNIKSSICF